MPLPHHLNTIDIGYFKENDNLNLILLVKKINLNMIEPNQYYLTINDVLVTWSLKIHFILNEVFFKHTPKLVDMFNTAAEWKTQQQQQQQSLSSSPFDLKILIESSMLVNIMLDYSQDSSKVEKPIQPAPQVTYFNSHFSLVETVSIILNDVCLAYSSSPRWLDLRIDELSMLANMDDQSLNDYFVPRDDDNRLHEDNTDDGNENGNNNSTDQDSLKRRRKFFVARRMRLVLDRASERLTAERRLLGTECAQNKLAEIAFDSIHVNYLFQYDFAKLLDHVLNLKKCLYLMHGYKKRQSPELSYDFCMSVKHVKLCVEDDPFEVCYI